MKNVLEYPNSKLSSGILKILQNKLLLQIVPKDDSGDQNSISNNLITEIDKIMKFKK